MMQHISMYLYIFALIQVMNNLRTIEAQILTKMKNNKARPKFTGSHNACISGFPRGATPGGPGGFVKSPKQSVFNPLGYRAGKSDQIPPPPGTKRS